MISCKRYSGLGVTHRHRAFFMLRTDPAKAYMSDKGLASFRYFLKKAENGKKGPESRKNRVESCGLRKITKKTEGIEGYSEGQDRAICVKSERRPASPREIRVSAK